MLQKKKTLFKPRISVFEILHFCFVFARFYFFYKYFKLRLHCAVCHAFEVAALEVCEVFDLRGVFRDLQGIAKV